MNYIGKIIEYLYDHQLPAPIIQRIHRRLIENKSDEAQTAALEAAWEKVGFPTIDKNESNEAFNKLQQRLGLTQENSIHTARRKPIWNKASIYAVACIVPLLILLSSLYVYQKTSQIKRDISKTFMVEQFVPAGERTMITLPDSSKVWLNSGTLLVYPSAFVGEKREVYLAGEGYFEIKKNEKQPFIVNVKTLDVEVVGTRFNILAYPESKVVTTTLEQGAVQVRLKESPDKIYRMRPNEQLTYHIDSKKADLLTVVSADYSDWREGGLFFDNASFKDVVRTIERVYGISVHLQTSIYNNNHLTVHFNKNESLENVFMLLAVLLPGLDYQIDGSDVYLE